MITIERPNNVKTSGIKESVSFGIKQEGLAHIFSVLRSQLYGDPVTCVLKEIATNGFDAHTEIGTPNRPIEITLPSRFNAILKIRDFGMGMTEEQVFETYAFYGQSSKRNSNQLIGQLGLGSKSPFAYGDNFVITSFVGGTKTTYNAYIDPSQIGKIAKLSSETTTEENGVEISLAVRDADIQAFHTKAHALFHYFRVKPIVKNSDFIYQERTPIMEGTGWRIFTGGKPMAVMGCVGYPIGGSYWNDSSISRVLTAGVEVDFTIGELEVAASREGLQYTDRTKKAIETKLTSVIKEITDLINKQFVDCKTLIEATKLYGQITNYDSPLYHIRGFAKSLSFKNRVINDSKIHFNKPADLAYRVSRFEKSWRGSRISSSPVSSIECDEKTLLIDNDLNLRSCITNRVHASITSGKRVYLISYNDKAQKKKFLDESGIEQSDMVLLSSLPKVSFATTGSSVSAHNSKHSSKEFIYDMILAPSRYNRKNSDYWKQESVDLNNDAGVYVVLDRFEYRNQTGGFTTPSNLREIVSSLSKMGIKIDKIYGFKKDSAEIAKKNSQMVSLFSHIDSELHSLFANKNISQKVANRIEYDANANFNWLGTVERYGSKANKKTLCFKTAEIFAHMRCDKDREILDACVAWKAYISPAAPEHKFSEVREAFEKKYPLIPMIRSFYSEDAGVRDAVLNYVNLIDG